jgi:eukaryotic-like serine/threonine-protein kinase
MMISTIPGQGICLTSYPKFFYLIQADMKKRFFITILLVTFFLPGCAPEATPTPETATIVLSTTSTATFIPLPTASPTTIPTPDKPMGSKKQSPVDGMIQLYVPAGEFQMGTSTDGDWIGEDEFPLHTVFLSSFWMDKTEITNAQYQTCVQAGVCTPPHASASETQMSYFDNADFAEYPVIQVDWEQARVYCQWAGRRLPAESEWEKAARGKLESLFPWEGDGKGPYFANFDIDDNWPDADTTPVGSIEPGASPYGVMDMAGNVYEWVSDWYAADYYQNSPTDNPPGPDQGTARVIRGGAWSSDWNFLRTASRLSY